MLLAALQSLSTLSWNIRSPRGIWEHRHHVMKVIDLCVFALNLIDAGLSYCCMFCANIRSQLLYGQFAGHTESGDSKVKLGLPRWRSRWLCSGHKLPCKCSCCHRGLLQPQGSQTKIAGSMASMNLSLGNCQILSTCQAYARHWEYSCKKDSACLGPCTIYT